MTKICECCGNEYTPHPITVHRQRYCSTKCAIKGYYSKHKKEHALIEKRRRLLHKERVREQDKKRNGTAKRKKWKQEYTQKNYIKNREAYLKYQSNYRRANPERRDHYKRRRRARIRGLEDTLTIEQWNKSLVKYNYSCAYCHTPKPKEELEREHKVPASRGGGFTSKNIVPACGRCNRRKKDMTYAEFRRFLKKYPNPD